MVAIVPAVDVPESRLRGSADESCSIRTDFFIFEQRPSAIAETVPGYEAISFYGVGVPNGTPLEIVELLNKVINLALEDPLINKTLVELGTLPAPGSSEDFRRLLETETARWAAAVRASGASIE